MSDIETGTVAARSTVGQGCFELDRRLPTAEQVYRLLRDAIITCRLEPNEAISENRICGMFGVSRSPVRIAVTRLAEDGLIEIYPQRGTFVAPIKLKQVHQAQFTRSAIEMALAEEAARHWTERHSREIAVNLDSQVVHAESADGRGFFQDNETFHQLIATAAKLGDVWNTVQSVKMIWDRIGHIANRVPAHMMQIIAEHRTIVKAMEVRDPAAAAAAMKHHLRAVDLAIARLRPSYSDYFVDE